MSLQLVFPSVQYYPSYLQAIEEYQQHHVEQYSFLDARHLDIFQQIKDYHLGKNLPQGYVKATYLWLVDNDEFIGEVCIRHELTPALLKFGGHVGYGIRYSKQRQGYGTYMLKETLKYIQNTSH